MKRHSSLPHIFLGNLLLSISTIFLFLIVGLVFPLTPDPKGYRQAAISVSDYLSKLKRMYLFFLILFITLISLSSIIEFIRTKIDISRGYKKIGIFCILKISNRGSYKAIKLNNGNRLKIKDSNENFNNIKEGQILEIEKTATGKFLSCKIVEQ